MKNTDSKKNKFGQYFTPAHVAKYMVNLSTINKGSKVLEPSCGEGVFIDEILKRDVKDIEAYEIDRTLAAQFDFVKYESFVTAKIKKKYDLIIGNPPYIRWKNLEDELKAELNQNELWSKYCNSLCDYLYIFIIKSINLLEEDGELIFICPEYWLNTTHSLSLRNFMIENGFFTHIIHFNETPIFDKVSISTIIFRYIKNKNKNKPKIDIVKYNGKEKLTNDTLELIQHKTDAKNIEYLAIDHFLLNDRWILEEEYAREKFRYLENACKNKRAQPSLIEGANKNDIARIGDFCDVGNGLVSGLDKAFQIDVQVLNSLEEQSILHVLKAKSLLAYKHGDITKYIFIKNQITNEEFKDKYPNFFKILNEQKNLLEKRYSYNRKINFWEWVFLRNMSLFSRKEKRIFVPCKERISNKDYFRFSLVKENIFPTQDVTGIFKKANTKESIEYICAYLNQPFIFDWLKSNGIVKGSIIEFSEKPINSIPFKNINWDDPNEVMLHNKITELTNKIVEKMAVSDLDLIKTCFKKLLKVENEN